ncbi:MAG: hypothetical protein PHG91_05600 [Syntrophales bacterium]|nr:hypothetical protein [Syntrophales bacterium]MDD5232848.1 hypothetical protein [Syntrophales bacterium]MDD5532587.1 hypothetical protein [Syntrophales bacterium]
MKIWIVVEAKRGFIQEPELFLDYISAENRREELFNKSNPDYDEVEIFEKRTGHFLP